MAEQISNLSLNRYPNDFSINESKNEISISLSFDNNTLSEQEADFDYSISFKTDSIVGVTTVGIEAEIVGNGNSAQKMHNAEEFLKNKVKTLIGKKLRFSTNRIFRSQHRPI